MKIVLILSFLEKILLDFGVEGKIKKNKSWSSCYFE